MPSPIGIVVHPQPGTTAVVLAWTHDHLILIVRPGITLDQLAREIEHLLPRLDQNHIRGSLGLPPWPTPVPWASGVICESLRVLSRVA